MVAAKTTKIVLKYFNQPQTIVHPWPLSLYVVA
jgi:hypothetical protein